MPKSVVTSLTVITPPTPNEIQAWQKVLEPALKRHHHPSFIETDPMQFPHAVRADALHCEVLTLVATAFSYGQRSVIVPTLHALIHQRFENNLLGLLQQESTTELKERLQGWYYRFQTSADALWFLQRLHAVLQRYGSLKGLMHEAVTLYGVETPQTTLAYFVDVLIGNTTENPTATLTHGQRYLLPNPREGSACKRLWLALRWLCRNDAPYVASGELTTPIDFGHWSDCFPPERLLLPVDTHVFKQGHALGIALRRTPDWRCAEEMTHRLRSLCQHDPTRYDFAFMGLGTL